ncbi:MAG: hypothetical protein JO065_15070 [Acidobacteria bacterium]|nr:hypothetical protein [Acidobacteriota bacterium]MBV9436629.1 hypothetical protein [Acidobacteriota bacterium]
MDPESKVLKFPPGSGAGSQSPQQMTDAQTTSATAVLAPPAPPQAEPPPPVWMQRFVLVTSVVICLWLGFVLSVLPWQTAWTDNALVANHPNLRWFLGTGFVRGLSTGLGLLDLWIGISEAVQYRDRR